LGEQTIRAVLEAEPTTPRSRGAPSDYDLAATGSLVGAALAGFEEGLGSRPRTRRRGRWPRRRRAGATPLVGASETSCRWANVDGYMVLLPAGSTIWKPAWRGLREPSIHLD
jgi:hypothetical protein